MDVMDVDAMEEDVKKHLDGSERDDVHLFSSFFGDRLTSLIKVVFPVF